jgi:hypothetical protein
MSAKATTQGHVTHREDFRPGLRNPRPTPAQMAARQRALQQDIERARKRALDTQRPAATRTDAHDRLAELMRLYEDATTNMTALYERLKAATAPVEKLEAARNAAAGNVAKAVAALARFDEEERQAIERWSSAAEGPSPEPNARARAQLADKVEAERRGLAHVEAAYAKKKEALAALAPEQRDLARQRTALIVAILYEEAELVGHRYAAALSDMAHCAGTLRGLDRVLRGFDGMEIARRPIRGIMGPLDPPAICPNDDPLAERQIAVPGFWLAAHNYMNLAAVVTPAEIAAAADRWAVYANALIGGGGTEDQAQAQQRAALLVENAALRRQLDDADSSGDRQNLRNGALQ